MLELISVAGVSATVLWLALDLVEAVWLTYENGRTRSAGGDR